MENKEPKTVRLSTVILLFIILILVVALVLMYIHYNKEPINEIANNTTKTESMNTTNTEESDRKELSVTSSTVKEVYEYIPAEIEYTENENRFINAYQSKKVTIDDLDDEIVLGHAYINTEIPIDERMPYEDENYDLPWPSWFKAKPDRLQETLLKMYNTEIENKSFYLGESYGSYENGIYTFTSGGGGNSFYSHIQNIEEAYEENDELYIIDTYLYYLDTYGEPNHVFKIYDASDHDTVIKRDVVAESDISQNASEGTFLGASGYVKENYLSKAPKYKHTFKKNDNGEYYWYSSEPYNEE